MSSRPEPLTPFRSAGLEEGSKTTIRQVVDPRIVEENEAAVRDAYDRGDYVLCFLLAHALVEALLRAFLERTGTEPFGYLIKQYVQYLESEGQQYRTFVADLRQFNRRRNRVSTSCGGRATN